MKAQAPAPTITPVSLLEAATPVLVLIALLSASVYLFGSDSSYGANQIALLLAGGVGVIIAVRHGHTWKDIEAAVIKGISTAMGAILILLAVGALIGTWMLSGTVPSMIYYGLKLLNPSVFFAASCLICAVTALAIGSSWTTAGTVGVGLIGVAAGLGLSPAMTAGAVISGAYFGDKMSPLSDTTNLAPAVAGTDIFTHIRHMTATTVPSLLIALVLFTIIGLGQSADLNDSQAQATTEALANTFDLSILTLIPLLVVLTLALRKFPAFPTIMIGALLGGVMAVILQPQLVLARADAEGISTGMAYLKGVWVSLSSGYVASTGNETVDSLLSRGGMGSMLNTIWLIITALTFGSVLERGGMLERLVRSALAAAKSTGALITAVLGTCIGINVLAADQYMAMVLPGKMYRAEFERRGLDPKNLSRAVEDSGTLTSALVPWNTCGAYMAGTLGVATLAYLPFTFFNLICPFVSAIYGYTGFTITKIDPSEREGAAADHEADAGSQAVSTA
ncbi:MAG: Na+/H+ antiporter NhaC [Pseudomonadota bacterium]